MSRRRILVTDAGRASALALIRAYGRAGHHVVAADVQARSPGARSKFADATARYPSPFLTSTGATAAAIARIATDNDIDLVIPVTDDTIIPLMQHRPPLPDGCVVAVAPEPALATAASKIETVQLAIELGLAVPDTEVVTSARQTAGLVHRLGTPVVLKPDHSRIIDAEGRLVKGPVRYAWTDSEAAELVAQCEQPVLAQRYSPGVGHGVGMVCRDGAPLVAVAHRRLHEVPVSGGASATRCTVAPTDELIAPARSLVQAMGWTGAVMVEFKVGSAGPVLMEVNGRLWGSLPLAMRAGCDVAGHLLDVHLDAGDGAVPACAAPIDTDYRVGAVARNLDLELRWIGSVLTRGSSASSLVSVRRRDGLGAMRDLLRRDQGDDLMASDDLGPVFSGIRSAVTHAVGKAVGNAH